MVLIVCFISLDGILLKMDYRLVKYIQVLFKLMDHIAILIMVSIVH